MIKVPNFNNITVSVLGDLMLDRYLFGKSDRISPEAPVPVVNISKTEDRAGGAANVAINLNQLGIQTNLLGLLGDDQEGQNLENILSKADHTKAITFLSENGFREERSWHQLNQNVSKMIAYFKKINIKKMERI